MDNFSVRSERNFNNLAAKPKRMHLLDEPSGYASAMVKSSLSPVSYTHLTLPTIA